MSLDQRQLGRTFVIMIWLVILFAVLVGFIVYVREGFAPAALTWISAGLLMIAALPTLRNRHYDLFEPLTFVLLMLTVGVTLKVPYIFLTDSPDALWTLLVGNPWEILIPSVLIISVGMSMFVLGYSMPVKPFAISEHRFFFRRVNGNSKLLITGSSILGLSALVFLLFADQFAVDLRNASLEELSARRFVEIEGSDVLGSMGYYRWIIGWSLMLFAIAFAHYMKPASRGRWLSGLLAFGCALLLVAYGVFTSSRSSTISVFIIAIIIIFYMRRKIYIQQWLLYLSIALLLFAMVSDLRGPGVRGGLEQSSGVDRLLSYTVGSRQLMDLSKTSLVVDAVPERIPYQYGSTLVSWIVAPIPRSMWPNKPPLGPGTLLGQELYGFTWGAVPPGFVAELYMNFHIFGVAVGMFLYGLFLTSCYKTFQPLLRSRNILGVSLYSILIVPLAYFLLATDFSKFMFAIISATLPFILVAFLVSKTPPSRINPNASTVNRHLHQKNTRIRH